MARSQRVGPLYRVIAHGLRLASITHVLRRAPLFVSAVLVVACSPMAVSPALRTVPLETVEPARVGHVSARAGGGGHADFFLAGGRGVVTGQGAIGIGVARDLELQLDGAFGDVRTLGGRSVSTFAGASRVGLKHRIDPSVAFTGGLGAGVGPWGAFAGGDLGVIVAYENPHVVPFFAARLQLSVPISPRMEIYVDPMSRSMSTTVLTPSATFWLQPSTGMRIPLTRGSEHDLRASLVLAVAWTVVYDDHGLAGMALGGEGCLLIEP